jgi:hypothetical protein
MADDSNNNNPFIDIVVEAGDGIIRLLEKLGLKEPEAQQIIDTLQQNDLLTGLDVRGVWTENGEIKVAQDTGVTNDQGQPVVRITGPALAALTQAIKNSSATDVPINVDNIAPEAKAVIQAALANDPSNFVDPNLVAEPRNEADPIQLNDIEMPLDTDKPKTTANSGKPWAGTYADRDNDGQIDINQGWSAPTSGPGTRDQNYDKINDAYFDAAPETTKSRATDLAQGAADRIQDTVQGIAGGIGAGVVSGIKDRMEDSFTKDGTPVSTGNFFDSTDGNQNRDVSTPQSPGNAFQDSEKVPQDISTPQSPGNAFQDSENSAWQPDTQTLGDKLMDFAKGQAALQDAGISNDLIDAVRNQADTGQWSDVTRPMSPGNAFQDSENAPQDISTPRSTGAAFQDSEANQWQDPSTPRSPGVAFQDSEKVPQDISTPQSPGNAFQDSENSAWQPDTQTLGDKLLDYAKGQAALRDAGISNDLIDAVRNQADTGQWSDVTRPMSPGNAFQDSENSPQEDPNFSSSEEWNDGDDAVYASELTPEMQAINDRTYEEQVAAQIPYTLDYGAITQDSDREAVLQAQAVVDQTTNQADWDNNGDVIGKAYDLTTHIGQLERARDLAQSTGQRLVQLIDANGQWSGSYADADGNEWMHTDANANGVEDHQEAYYAQQAAQSGEYGVPLANPDGTWTGMGIRPDGSTYVWENSDGDGIEDHAEQAMYEAANLVPVTNSDNQQVYAEGNPVYYYTSDADMVTPGNEDYSSTVASYTTDTTRPPNPGEAANLGAL